MSNDCQSCSAPAELFICNRCIEELKADLTKLAHGPVVLGRPTAGLLDNLNDVVTRQTCLGGSSGHRKRGDEMPDLFEPHNEKSSPEKVKLTRQGQAAELAVAARNSLTTIVRDVCETRGVPVSPVNNVAACASWLAEHVHALACGESAGIRKAEIGTLVRKIERVIDRPPAPKFCGQCDKMNDDRKMCGFMLSARHDAIEVTCPTCRTTHNVDALRERWLSVIDYQIVAREEIIGNQRTPNPELYDTGIMGLLEEFVHWQSFNRWVREHHLKPVRYQRPNGRRGFFRHGPEDVPEYRVGDVRGVRRRMDRSAKAKTG
jgi:hypothetical protein